MTLSYNLNTLWWYVAEFIYECFTWDASDVIEVLEKAQLIQLYYCMSTFVCWKGVRDRHKGRLNYFFRSGEEGQCLSEFSIRSSELNWLIHCRLVELVDYLSYFESEFLVCSIFCMLAMNTCSTIIIKV